MFLGNKFKYHIFLLKYDIFIIVAHDENLNLGVSCFLHMLLNSFKHIFLLLESFSTFLKFLTILKKIPIFYTIFLNFRAFARAEDIHLEFYNFSCVIFSCMGTGFSLLEHLNRKKRKNAPPYYTYVCRCDLFKLFNICMYT